MPDEPQELLQTPAPEATALFPDEAAVLRATDAWQVKGFSVWDAVKVQIAAEMPEPSPFRAEDLSRSLYETASAPQKRTDAPDAPVAENGVAELIALVRDLQDEVRELKQEVQGLKKQVAAQPFAPPASDARPAAYPAPRGFRATPAAQHPPFPLFRD